MSAGLILGPKANRMRTHIVAANTSEKEHIAELLHIPSCSRKKWGIIDLMQKMQMQLVEVWALFIRSLLGPLMAHAIAHINR